MEHLQEKHRKEKKELQAQIQKLKKSVPKGDKKCHKEIMEQIATLESNLRIRHSQELENFSNDPVKGDSAGIVNDIETSVGTMHLNNEEDQVKGQADSNPIRKGPSRAHRRREKKAAAARQRDEEIRLAAEEEERMGPRSMEYRRFRDILSGRDLSLHEVPSDGNCLYCAVQHQLCLRGHSSGEVPAEAMSVSWLRRKTATYMGEHPDDFMPFMSNPETGEPLTRDDYTNYCELIAETSAWGGQPEIRALSNILEAPIEVLQADSPAVIVGDEFSGPPLTLTYHRHAFGLGEHYNSVLPSSNGGVR